MASSKTRSKDCFEEKKLNSGKRENKAPADHLGSLYRDHQRDYFYSNGSFQHFGNA
jgi:hypothetical protein